MPNEQNLRSIELKEEVALVLKLPRSMKIPEAF
jgi:hypothetical protein